MKKFENIMTLALVIAITGVAGIGIAGEISPPPQFSVAWSEYPSWSAIGVASDLGIINGKPGELGELEKKYNVDIVLKLAEYDPCLTMYAAEQVDAVCITNIDALKPSMSVPSVAILPTSTSNGADTLIVPSTITDIKQLKGKKIFGAAQTVSEYVFNRNIELIGEQPSSFKFTNMDPGAAATAMQQGNKDIEAIMVWNPFSLQTLNQRKDAKVLLSSAAIPGEVVDMVVMSQKALKREGGDRAAKCICETFYRLNTRLNNPDTRDDTLLALGERFAKLTLQNMRQAVRETAFYSTPEAGLALFMSPEFKSTMSKVTAFCVKSEMLPAGQVPKLSYGTEEANLRFDPTFMKAVSDRP